MSARLTVSQVRERFDAALVAGGFTRSRFAPDSFGRDTDHLLPKSYSVSTPSSSIDAFDGRDNYRDEGEATTRVEVRTAYRLRSDDQSGDYGLALDHEQAVIVAVMDGINGAKLHLRLDSVPDRSVSLDGAWLICRIRWTVYHRFSFV